MLDRTFTARSYLAMLIIAIYLVAATSTQGQEDSKQANSIYFPIDDEWQTVAPEAVGWNKAALNKALDFAMSRKSSGVVILYRGRILAERYQQIPSPSRRYLGGVRGKDKAGRVIEDVASVQKSVASLLVGIAQEKGLLKISDPVHKHLGKGWSNATAEQESQITIKHLISMSTGLDSRLKYVVPPGTRWKYNTEAYCLSLKATAKAAKLSENELTEAWLTKTVGMQNSRWIKRRVAANATPETNPFGFATTARDLARFGLLILADGQWGKTKVLADRDYLKQALNSSQKINPAYGYLWWLNGKSAVVRGNRRIAGPLNRQSPKDLVAALGALGRKCYVVPSLGIVVTRLGDAPNVSDGPSFDAEFWRLMMQAAP